MLYCDYPPDENAYKVLKRLDNVLFASDTSLDKPLNEKTWECMDDLPDVTYSFKILNEKLGTGFPHYWFYKLEFVLWHERQHFNREDEWKGYRLNSRNSVEHIGPQNPRDPRDKVCAKELNSFGNLVLVTRSINSEYGDLSYREKRAKFTNKKEKGRFDSLKSDLIYTPYSTWNDKKAKDHKLEMQELMKSYISECGA